MNESNFLGIEELAAWHLLTSIRGLGPKASKAIHDAGLIPQEVIARPALFPLRGKRARGVVASIRALTDRDRESAFRFARNQHARARELDARILSYRSAAYPPLVLNSNNPIPVLWMRGHTSILQSMKVVACVGSRKIRSPYLELQTAFADVALAEGFTIASGFATGADSVAHRRALERGGATICVMPCGVDLVFPPENRGLWSDLMESGRAVFLSEFPLGRRAEGLTLRKRNKLIVAAALGVLVGQTGKSGGAMNAFRFALEQRKPVATFDPDGGEDTTGNAEIRDSPKGTTVSLPIVHGIQDYRQWLHELSFSTSTGHFGGDTSGTPAS